MVLASKSARAWKGGKYGALLGIVFFTLGLVSWLIAIAVGVESDYSLRGIEVVLPVYVGSFFLGGAVIGLLWDLRRSLIGAVVMGSLGSSVVVGGCVLCCLALPIPLQFTLLNVSAIGLYTGVSGAIVGLSCRKIR